jgi:hypothetical protein
MAKIYDHSYEVLSYRKKGASQATVRRHYLLWRNKQALPERCDNPPCFYYTNPLVWNDKPIKLILDHRNGNNSDNRTENLRFLCPNCESQLDTRGGANKGRVEKSEGGFALISREGKRHDHIIPKTGTLSLTGRKVKLVHNKKSKRNAG